MTSIAADHPSPFETSARARRRGLGGLLMLAMSGRGRGRHGGHGFGRGPWMWGGPQMFFGGPGGRRGFRARRGDVRAAALLLLAEEPRNGYQLMQEIEARSNGVWRPSPGSVYPALSQLGDEGLVRAEESEGRRTFTLTDAGRTYVEEHRDELGSPWDEMSGAVGDDLAALASDVRQVMMATAQIGQIGNDNQLVAASKILTEARKALYGILASGDQPGDAGA